MVQGSLNQTCINFILFQVHIVFTHITQFIDSMADLNDGKLLGLGLFSEQAFESGIRLSKFCLKWMSLFSNRIKSGIDLAWFNNLIPKAHQDFAKICQNFHVTANSPPDRFLRVVCYYNSMHCWNYWNKWNICIDYYAILVNSWSIRGKKDNQFSWSPPRRLEWYFFPRGSWNDFVIGFI